MDLLYDQRLYYGVVSAALCGALGSWIGTRSNLDEWAGAVMGMIFSGSISLGFSKMSSGMLPIVLIILICFITFASFWGGRPSWL